MRGPKRHHAPVFWCARSRALHTRAPAPHPLRRAAFALPEPLPTNSPDGRTRRHPPHPFLRLRPLRRRRGMGAMGGFGATMGGMGGFRATMGAMGGTGGFEATMGGMSFASLMGGMGAPPVAWVDVFLCASSHTFA